MSKENSKKDARRERKIISLAPMWLFRREFREGLEEKPDDELSVGEVRGKCFEVLELLDQYHRKPKTPEAATKVKKGFKTDDLADVDAYLNAGEEETEPASDENAPDSHQAFIVEKVRELLAYPRVRELVYGELDKETAFYRRYRKNLERLKKLRAARLKAETEMHRVYLDSHSEHKKLVASAGKRIKALTGFVHKLETDEARMLNRAKRENGPEFGLISAQELLRYKRQMRDHNFALTPSREKLLKTITEHAMAGKKVFLVGSTGTGKTELAFYVANELTGGYELIPWHEGTAMKDILGQMQIRRDEEGAVTSQFKPGPMPRAYSKGKALVHEEITAGATRTMMGMKPFLNLRPGQRIKIPEMNGEALCVDDIIIELFTGNPKDERTKEREEMDPAILRMLTGIHVQFMPAEELKKIVLAGLIEDSGVLTLSRAEVTLIDQLAQAAELMQMCHDDALPEEAAEQIRKATGLDDLRLTKNFLDPGTFFGFFKGFDAKKMQGMTLAKHLSAELKRFIDDPKALEAPEEKQILVAILKLKGVVAEGSTPGRITVPPPAPDKGYLLPSELGFLNAEEGVIEDDPFADENAETADPEQKALLDLMKGFPSKAPSASPETAALIETLKLKEQYDARRETLKFFGFTDKPAPSFEAVAGSFTKEDLELARTFQEPTLLLIPQCSFERKYKAIDANKTMFNNETDPKKQQQDCYVNTNVYKPESGLTPKVTGWKVMIVDGAKEMPADKLKTGDDLSKTLGERRAARKAARRKKADGSDLELGLDRHAYAMLMMEALKSGNPEGIIDQQTYTLLDDEDDSIWASLAPNARWSPGAAGFRGVVFDAGRPVGPYDRARFRSGAGGRVLS
jgi:MoxR-like ATPase